MINVLFILIQLFLVCYSFDDQKELLRNATKNFIDDFLMAEYQENCLLGKTLDMINEFSFDIQNYLGEYPKCRINHMFFYYYCMSKTKDFDNSLNNKSLVQVFPNAIFDNVICFGMCLPKCVKLNVNDFNRTFLTGKCFKSKQNYTVRFFNLTDENDIINKDKNFLTTYLILSIFCSFFLICLVFSIFNNFYEISKFLINLLRWFLCCRRRKENESISIYIINKNNDSIPKESIEKRLDSSRFMRYLNILSNTFDIKKSVNRFIKMNQYKGKITSKFVNDNSLGFFNGIKSILLCLMIMNSIGWQSVYSPITISLINRKLTTFQTIISDFKAYSILYYFYFAYGIYWCVHGFVLAYKFLFYIIMREESKNESTIKLVTVFILRNSYIYFIYVFFFFITTNLDIFLYGRKYRIGPLLFIFRQTCMNTLKEKHFFLFPVINFLIHDYPFLADGSQSFSFFFLFVNEIQYYLVSIVILLIYRSKRNKKSGAFILFVIYASCLFLKTMIYAMDHTEKMMNSILGFDFFYWRFYYGYTTYLIGVIFGILFFEFNAISDEQYNITSKSNTNNSKNSDGNEKIFLREIAKDLGLNKRRLLTSISVLLLTILYTCGYFIHGFIGKDFKQEMPFYMRFFFPIEIDIFAVSFQIILFNYVITNNSQLKLFLEKKIWIPLSRSFYPIMFFVTPFISVIIFDFSSTVEISQIKTIFLFISLMIIAIIISSVYMVIFQIPLKVLFKHLFK